MRLKNLSIEGFWVVLGQFLSISGSLLLVRLLTEYLEPAEFGKLALGLTISGLINQIVMGGVSSAIGRFYSLSLSKGQLDDFFKASIYITKSATLIVLFIGVIIVMSLFFFQQFALIDFVAVILLYSLLSGYNSSINSIQNSARQRLIVAVHSGLDSWLKVIFLLILASLININSFIIVLAYCFSLLLVNFSQLFFLSKIFRFKLIIEKIRVPKVLVREMWIFLWPVAAGGIFSWGYYASQRWVLEFFSSTADVGKFQALTQISYAPMSLFGSLIMSMIAPILYQRASDLSNAESINKVRKIIYYIFLFFILTTLICSILSFYFHEEIFNLLIAKKYHDVSVYMPLIVISAGILQSSIILGTFLTVLNKTKEILSLSIFGQVLIIVLNVLFTYYYQLSGLIYSMILGSLIHLIWMSIIILINENKRNGRK